MYASNKGPKAAVIQPVGLKHHGRRKRSTVVSSTRQYRHHPTIIALPLPQQPTNTYHQHNHHGITHFMNAESPRLQKPHSGVPHGCSNYKTLATRFIIYIRPHELS